MTRRRVIFASMEVLKKQKSKRKRSAVIDEEMCIRDRIYLHEECAGWKNLSGSGVGVPHPVFLLKGKDSKNGRNGSGINSLSLIHILSQLKYFTTGYTLDKYGNPQGTLADVTVDSYQKNADGSLAVSYTHLDVYKRQILRTA